MTKLEQVCRAVVSLVSERAKKPGPLNIKRSWYHSLVMFINQLRFEKYRNPDRRCTYPFEPCAAGYCWGYANFVDGNKPWADRPMEKNCQRCDMWAPKAYQKKSGVAEL